MIDFRLTETEQVTNVVILRCQQVYCVLGIGGYRTYDYSPLLSLQAGKPLFCCLTGEH